MKTSSRSIAAFAALAASSGVSASILNYCVDGNNVCYEVAIPQGTAQSGSGNIYFQMKAKTSYSWVALGTGSRMSGSNMFIMYQDGRGNVTVSPRHGTQHTMPTEDTSSQAAKLTLLAGSGVSGDTMTANVMCSNCQSWQGGGSLSTSSTSSPWIVAWKSGSSLRTTNKNAAISQHDDSGSVSLDLTKGVVTSDANPFVSGGSGSSSGNGGSSSGGSSGSGNGDGDNSGSNGSGGVGSSGGSGVTVTGGSPDNDLVNAHGILMALCFVILYPLGSMLMPIVGNWILHAGWQTVTFVLMWVGFGLGITIAKQGKQLFNNSHTILGVVVCAALVIQPILGFVHHNYYVAHQKRGVVSYVHLYWGRLFMALGIVTGGLGLQLANASTKLVVAYAVVAVIIVVLYGLAKLLGLFRKRRATRSKDAGGESSPRWEERQIPMRPYQAENDRRYQQRRGSREQRYR